MIPNAKLDETTGSLASNENAAKSLSADIAERKKNRSLESGEILNSSLFAQVSVELKELIKHYMSLTQEVNSKKISPGDKVGNNSSIEIRESDVTPHRSGPNSDGKLEATQKSKDKGTTNLDAAMLEAVGQMVPFQSTVPRDITLTEVKSDTRMKQVAIEHKSPAGSSDLEVMSDFTKSTNTNLGEVEKGRKERNDKNADSLSTPQVARPGMIDPVVAVAVPTVTQAQRTPDQADSKKDAYHFNPMEAVQAKSSPSADNNRSAGTNAALDSTNEMESIKWNHKSKSMDGDESNIDQGQPTNLMFNQFPDLPIGVISEQANTAHLPRQRANQGQGTSSGHNDVASIEGIKFSLDSLGQEKSVQIIGTNQTGFTLRPSDEQVHGLLKNNADGSLPISIEDVPGAADTRSDTAKLSIKAVSGNGARTA
ncbi:unnamed protein product [Sphagnum balticum]